MQAALGAEGVGDFNPGPPRGVGATTALGPCLFAVTSSVARAHLSRPLGSRTIVEASTGRPIPAFDERQLAAIAALPDGFRLSGDVPPGPAPDATTTATGDVRSYTSSAGSLVLVQLAGSGSPPFAGAPQGVVTAATVGSHPATAWFLAPIPLPTPVLIGGVPVGEPPSVRGVMWADGGYSFTLTSTGSPALSTVALLAIAGSGQPPPSNQAP